MRGGPEAVLCDFGPVFGLIFGNFSSQKHCFLRYFCLLSKFDGYIQKCQNHRKYRRLCRPVAKNLANTTVFGRWVKKTL